MMKIPKVAILLAEGFEEAEAIIIYNALCRVKIAVHLLACQDDIEVKSYHGIEMRAHALLKDKQTTLYDAVILPGGPDGTVNLGNNPNVIDFIKRHDKENKWICPICSAAAKVLSKNKLLNGRKYVCSGDLYKNVQDGIFVDQDVVCDGNLLSGKGLGMAFKFAFTLAESLKIDKDEVHFQAEHIYINY
ncbi:DJ-1/PfpI family protein [Gilliamella sp. B2911]|uniref:DJ-1/PfpI family protein n=1 Tax=Gilliamella sp. B2911 TaxID=2817980 RepID=UPI00226A1BD5|nr:DJ-1/PfpI family protein [Gilliamella sp. B2911]MCX8663689.1 DJ-1/PfpI family protein [Gilliamella sp. B2911]